LRRSSGDGVTFVATSSPEQFQVVWSNELVPS
jgi:hypothetical protein